MLSSLIIFKDIYNMYDGWTETDVQLFNLLVSASHALNIFVLWCQVPFICHFKKGTMHVPWIVFPSLMDIFLLRGGDRSAWLELNKDDKVGDCSGCHSLQSGPARYIFWRRKKPKKHSKWNSSLYFLKKKTKNLQSGTVDWEELQCCEVFHSRHLETINLQSESETIVMKMKVLKWKCLS